MRCTQQSKEVVRLWLVDGVRAITRLLLCVLLLGSGLVSTHAADNTYIPPIALLADIQLMAYPGWFLSIGADGSGSIGYGSNASDFAPVPARTFDFEKVYSSLTTIVRVPGSMRESYSVVFRQRDATTTSALYADDADRVLGLFNTAKQNAVGPNKERVHELWERSPLPRAPFDYRRLITGVASDIASLGENYPQLEDFSVAKHLQADRLVISYSYHTHEPPQRGGWTSGVPNPDQDGIWFHIDFHDRDSSTELHTQPAVVAPHCVGNMKVSFLSLEGVQTKSVDGAIWRILKKHGARECDLQVDKPH